MYDSIATIGNADMKLGRCVGGTKVQVRFEMGLVQVLVACH